MIHIMLVAGEASGDNLGAGLMRALKAQAPDIRFSGVGGAQMESEGLASLVRLEDIAVMGLSDVIRRLPLLLRAMRITTQAARDARPDALVIIDSPDFTHRVARKLARLAPDIPIINYVPPSVWAWRPKRAKRMTRFITRALGILPFEPKAFEELKGPRCVYVGNPALERIARDEDAEAFRHAHTISADTLLLLVAPGSRPHETRRLLPHFGAALRLLQARLPNLRCVIPVVPNLRDAVKEAAADWPVAPIFVETEAEKHAAFAAADAALAASGTITLEIALAGTPSVCAYEMGRVEWALAHRLVRTRFVSPVNLILGREVIPEHLQDIDPTRLADALMPLFESEARAEAGKVRAALFTALALPDNETPSMRAAREVLDVLGR